MFWDNLKSELDYQGISIKELASKAGLQQQSIYNAITRKTLPNLETACKIAKVLNVSVEYLYSGNGYSGLSDEELGLLIYYRKLNKEKQQVIKQMLTALSSLSG